MNSEMMDIFSNDNQGIFSDNLDLMDIYNLNGKIIIYCLTFLEDKSDLLIFPSAMILDKEFDGKKDEKGTETNSKAIMDEKGIGSNKNDKKEITSLENPEEPKKPKINVLSQEETKSYFNEAVKNENIDAFIREFKRNGFKKKQPDGTVWNEVTKKFEKSQDMLEIEKEIEKLHKDKELEIKNFHAKNLNKEISEKIKSNPEKSKEILKELTVKKLDPQEAFKDLNKNLYKDVLNTSTSLPSKDRDRTYTDKNVESSKRNRDNNQENFSRNNYNERKNNKYHRDERSNRKGRQDRNDKYNSNRRKSRENSSKSDTRKNSYNNYDDNRNKSYISYRDNGSAYSKDKRHLCKDYDRHKDMNLNNNNNNNNNNHFDKRNHEYQDKRSKSKNFVRELSQPNLRNNRDQKKNLYGRDKSQDRHDNRMDKSLLSNTSILQSDNNYMKETKIKNNNVSNMEINIATPENKYYSNHIDLTDDDVICYVPAENENMKRKKLHEEMKDLVVNVKVDNINYILNNQINPSAQQVEISLEEFTSKLLKDLKLISNETHHSQMFNYLKYVDNQMDDNSTNVLYEYIRFRDKSISTEKEVLVMAIFYYAYLLKNIVKSSVKRGVELKIIQQNSMIMNGHMDWNNKNNVNNSNYGSFPHEKNTKNKNSNPEPNKLDNRHNPRTNNINKSNDNFNSRKSPSYVPTQIESDQEEDIIMNGEMPTSYKSNSLNVSKLLFGDFEENNKKSAAANKSNSDKPLNLKLQNNPRQEDNRSRSKSPLRKDKIQIDIDEKNRREKSIDPMRSHKDFVKGQRGPPQSKEVNDVYDDSQDKPNAIPKKVNNDNKKNEKVTLKDNEEKNNKKRERDRSKSPLNKIDSHQSEIKKDFLKTKRSYTEKDDLNSTILDNTIIGKKSKKFRENADYLQEKEKNDCSIIVDDEVSKTRNKEQMEISKKKEKEKNEKKNEKENFKAEIESKLRDITDRDEKYNLIMKYAHKINDAENLKDLKTLIPKENSIKLENALKGNSNYLYKFSIVIAQEETTVDLYENELMRIMVKICPNQNFKVLRKFKFNSY